MLAILISLFISESSKSKKLQMSGPSTVVVSTLNISEIKISLKLILNIDGATSFMSWNY